MSNTSGTFAVSFIKNAHSGLFLSCSGKDRKCPCFNFGIYHFTSLYMFSIFISMKSGKNPVSGLKQNALNPRSFTEVIGTTSGSPASLSHIIILQSSGTFITCEPILITAAGDVNISRNTNGWNI